MADDTDSGEPRADETLGIDRSEQSGLGGNTSVLEEYGKDTVRDDLPEKPVLEAEDKEPVLPGTDPDVPKDVVEERGGPDPTLPKLGHEVREGPQKAVAGLKHRSLDPMDPSGNVE